MQNVLVSLLVCISPKIKDSRILTVLRRAVASLGPSWEPVSVQLARPSAPACMAWQHTASLKHWGTPCVCVAADMTPATTPTPRRGIGHSQY